MTVFTTWSSMIPLLLQSCKRSNMRCHQRDITFHPTLSRTMPSGLGGTPIPSNWNKNYFEVVPLKKLIQLKRLATRLTDYKKPPCIFNCLVEVNAHTCTQWEISVFCSNRKYITLKSFFSQLFLLLYNQDFYFITVQRNFFKRKIKKSLPKKPVAALFFLIRYMVQDRGEDIPNCPWLMFKFLW